MHRMIIAAAALAFATPAVLAAHEPESVTVPQAGAAVPDAAAGQPVPESADAANAGAPPLPTTEEVIPGTRPGQPATHVTTHHGNLTPPPATALGKSYPVCTRALQDGCRNPGEGGDEASARGG